MEESVRGMMSILTVASLLSISSSIYSPSPSSTTFHYHLLFFHFLLFFCPLYFHSFLIYLLPFLSLLFLFLLFVLFFPTTCFPFFFSFGFLLPPPPPHFLLLLINYRDEEANSTPSFSSISNRLLSLLSLIFYHFFLSIHSPLFHSLSLFYSFISHPLPFNFQIPLEIPWVFLIFPPPTTDACRCSAFSVAI